MAKRIVVTGCAGFIGSRIVRELIKQGHHVLGIDSLSGLLYPTRIKTNRLKEHLSQQNFRFVELDLSSHTADISEQLEGYEYLINEAGLPGQLLSWSHFDEYLKSNLLAVERLIRMAQFSGIRTMIQASTSSVYGTNAIGNEDQPTVPCSPYGVSKLAAEHLINCLQPDTDIEIRVLRYFSVYGPGQRPDMAISKFLRAIELGRPVQITGDGHQLRDCTYVDDIVNGTLRCLFLADGSGTYNLSSGVQHSVNDIVNSCFEVSGRSVQIEYLPRPHGDQEETHGDSTRAREVFGYLPQVSLRLGIASQLDEIRRESSI